MMVKLGFIPLITAQCVYVNLKTGVIAVTHVDVFFVYGSAGDLIAMRRALQEEYECRGQILGPDLGEQK